ncbi:MAG TPA: hypothetical protein VNX70_02260 [Bryobacteraceae bacterium]|nr:hypothetical protein [Bryobacteraceae bacterium]
MTRRQDSRRAATMAIDRWAMSATLEGVRVRLTSAALMAFESLARSAGRVQSRGTLTYQALGGPSKGHGDVLTVSGGRA